MCKFESRLLRCYTLPHKPDLSLVQLKVNPLSFLSQYLTNPGVSLNYPIEQAVEVKVRIDQI